VSRFAESTTLIDRLLKGPCGVVSEAWMSPAGMPTGPRESREPTILDRPSWVCDLVRRRSSTNRIDREDPLLVAATERDFNRVPLRHKVGGPKLHQQITKPRR
jgi:hypothetical protein